MIPNNIAQYLGWLHFHPGFKCHQLSESTDPAVGLYLRVGYGAAVIPASSGDLEPESKTILL